MKLAAIAFLLTVSTTAAFAAEDNLCQQLADFRNAPFEKDMQGKPLRRYIEYHWLGYWMDFDNGWAWECRPTASAANKKFCDYLKKNVSFEFPSLLPKRILTCSGWKIPYSYQLEFERVTFQLLRHKGDKIKEDEDRYMLLETDMRPHQPNQDFAIRLSVIPNNEKSPAPEPRLEVTYSPDATEASHAK